MLKVIYTAAMLSALSITTLAAFADDVKPPSATAICGYQWREAKKADATLKGRDAWNAFRVEKCGGKSKTRNDDAIKQYLETHKEKVTQIEACSIECDAPYQEVRKGKGK